jgi:hypothetical protein
MVEVAATVYVIQRAFCFVVGIAVLALVAIVALSDMRDRAAARKR